MHLRHLQLLFAVAGIIYLLTILPGCTALQIETTLDTLDTLRPAIRRATAVPTDDKNPVTAPAPRKPRATPATPPPAQPAPSPAAPSPSDTTTQDGPDLPA